MGAGGVISATQHNIAKDGTCVVQQLFHYGGCMSLKSSANKIMCALSSRWRLIDAIEQNDVAGVRQLLESGVDPNPSKRAIKRWENNTIRIPLFAALYCPTATILQLLLAYGADPHIQMHQHYKSRRIMHLEVINAPKPTKKKTGVERHQVSVLHHLIGISCGNTIRRSYCIDLSPANENFFEMYKMLRAHLPLTAEDQTLLEHYLQYSGQRQARLYLQWEEDTRQRQEILNNIEIEDRPQPQRKI